ncbi:hypothetical protein HI914_05938 [Erysiphe necator]|nr:hypothetical protein HI914_05938 [Erysiphe necator]
MIQHQCLFTYLMIQLLISSTHASDSICTCHYEVQSLFLHRLVFPHLLTTVQGNLQTLDNTDMPPSSCKYPSRENMVRSVRFEPTISHLKLGRCPGYPDSTWEMGPDYIPTTLPTIRPGCVVVVVMWK